VRAEKVTGPVAYHAEGPVWSERWGGLRWVDMLAGDVLSLAAGGTINRRHVGNDVCCVVSGYGSSSLRARAHADLAL
jgi:sugar lactone lactonase YvrE